MVKGYATMIEIVDMLIHNMQMKGIPKEYTEWLERRLAGRKTVLVFDDHQTAQFAIDNGLDQDDHGLPSRVARC